MLIRFMLLIKLTSIAYAVSPLSKLSVLSTCLMFKHLSWLAKQFKCLSDKHHKHPKHTGLIRANMDEYGLIRSNTDTVVDEGEDDDEDEAEDEGEGEGEE